MRANPILALGMAAGALAFPGVACALGLGKLTVQSSIGQPLSAQIELSTATKEELDSLTVKVADPGLYRQNNLAYSSVLARARITLERGASGAPYLKVVTQSAVSDPFLDLMVEVNWASGRLVRDYTFLLDPPGVTPSPVEPVAPVRIGVAPPRPAAAPAAAEAAAAARDGAGGEQYPVKRGDTLSKIASEHKSPSVTLEQMLVALFVTNQSAFDGNNINRLRAGSIVSIPSSEVAAATAPPEAAKIVRMQAADWHAYRDRVAAAAPATGGAPRRSAGGRIAGATVEAPPPAPPGRDQLKVSRDAGAGKRVGGSTEEMVARERQIKEAQLRIAELEKTLTDLQRAVELKNQSMAQLQSKADAAKAPPAKAAEPAKAPELKVAESARTEPAKTVEPPKAAEPPKVVEPPKGVEPPKVVEPPRPAPKAEPAATVPPKAQPSFLDDLMTNTPTWAIGGGALALLGGIAAILAARRRKPTRFDDGIIADTDIKTNTVFGSTGGGVVNTGDNSLSSDFSREGLANIDSDEVDPIAEAEVYLAYGRDAQAEEILRHALRKDPQRQEVYLKLLEIHAQHNKPSEFDAVAAELYSISKGQGETWEKAVALGRQLDPSNPMFAGADAVAAVAAAATGEAPTLAAEPGPASADAAGAALVDSSPPPAIDSPFDVRLDEDLAVSLSEVPTRSPADMLSGAQSEFERSAGGAAAGGLFADAGSFGAARPAQTIEEQIDGARAIADLDFHLDEPAPALPPRQAAPAEPPLRSQPAIDLDRLDLSFEHDEPAPADSTPSVLDGQWHDAATKLDLAKAYHEMGDVEGAREILQEVLREGDEAQKQEAQALISKLG